MTKSITIIIALLLMVGAALVFFHEELPATPTQPQGSTPTTTLAEQAGLPTKLKDVPGAERAALAAVDGSDSFGTAYRLIAEGTTRHTAELRMPIPPSGTVYEGWLVRPSPFHFISTGVIRRSVDGTDEPSELRKWNLNFRSDIDYSDYTNVVITLETVVDETPEDHILEGSF